jgi:SPP1 family phage portal protein
MELTEIQALSTNMDALKKKVTSEVSSRRSFVLTYLKQYHVDGHESIDTAKRPDKVVTTDQGTKTVPVTRLGLPVQKQIVALAAAFLCGNPIKLSSSPEDDNGKNMLAVVKRTWEKNKLDYDSKRIAKLLFSETEVAELWYVEKPDAEYWSGTVNADRPFRLRMKVLANSLGDELFPVFNNAGDLVAFGRGYQTKVDGKTIDHFDLYTDEKIYFGISRGNGWEIEKEEPNQFKKIPVIYYCQPAPEWSDVQSLIDRWEKTLSNHSDTNDYFASPMVKVTGEIKGFATKGESGKVIELKDGADAAYMSWDQSPKSLELEFKNLRSLIFDMTSTPDISIEQMKSLGTYSGIALKMLFLSAHLKAADKEENFGQCIQRRINLIKSAMAVINISLKDATSLSITPVFEYYLPKDEEGIINMLVGATGGKPIMTQESAVRANPLVHNADIEVEKIKEETTVVDITPIP